MRKIWNKIKEIIGRIVMAVDITVFGVVLFPAVAVVMINLYCMDSAFAKKIGRAFVDMYELLGLAVIMLIWPSDNTMEALDELGESLTEELNELTAEL